MWPQLNCSSNYCTHPQQFLHHIFVSKVAGQMKRCPAQVGLALPYKHDKHMVVQVYILTQRTNDRLQNKRCDIY